MKRCDFKFRPDCGARLDSLCPSDATACSPSSDTPETDAAAFEIFTGGDYRLVKDLVHADYARNLERQRNASLKDAEKSKAYKRVLKNENARLRRMLNLPENADVDAPRRKERQ